MNGCSHSSVIKPKKPACSSSRSNENDPIDPPGGLKTALSSYDDSAWQLAHDCWWLLERETHKRQFGYHNGQDSQKIDGEIC